MSTPTRTCPSCSTPLPGVAAFCYVCGTATPPGMNVATGMRIAITPSGVTTIELRTRLQRALGPGYELGSRVGAGGFAEVFKAQDLRLKRNVAVKVLKPDLGLSPGMLERFQREAETIAALRHPNIVPIFDVGEAGGIAYIIMPFIEGESLRARLEREGALPVPEVRRVLREAAAGLAAAHDAGVIHRDVKPENIMLEGRDARVLLMDFGIAKAVGGDEETPATEEGVAPQLTSTGIIVGTPQYMSPEQACGDKTIDARTDQYSLGVVGYRMLSGKLPFEGESTRAVLYKQLVSDPPPLTEKVPDAPPLLSDAITRAMLKEPRERFASMTEFGEAVSTPEPDKVAPAKSRWKRSEPKRGATKPEATPPAVKPPAAAVKPADKQAGPSTKPRRVAPVMIVAGLGLVAFAAVLATRGGSPGIDDFLPISAIGGLDSELPPTTTGTDPVPPPAATAQRPAPPPAAATTQQRQRNTPAPAGGNPRQQAAEAAAEPAQTGAQSCASLFAAANWADAFVTCNGAAEAGDAGSMRRLALMYDRGNGTAENPVHAVEWFRKAAPRDAEAKFQLSRMVEIGRGTPRDARANVALLREAAAMGHNQAILTLASRLENGAGMSRDYEESATWYQRAADNGSVQALLKLGDWYRRGRGVAKDEAKGVESFRKAGEAGSPVGAWEAARAYLEGRGVPRDEDTGMTLLRRAASLGNQDAVAELRKRSG